MKSHTVHLKDGSSFLVSADAFGEIHDHGRIRYEFYMKIGDAHVTTVVISKDVAERVSYPLS